MSLYASEQRHSLPPPWGPSDQAICECIICVQFVGGTVEPFNTDTLGLLKFVLIKGVSSF